PAMMTVQLVEGRPQLLLDGHMGSINLQINTSIADGTWHTLHVLLDQQGAVLLADLCGRGWSRGVQEDSHCAAQSAWPKRASSRPWSNPGPLQVGGVPHDTPTAKAHGWANAPTTQNLHGCIQRLSVNGQLVDLGSPASSSGSTSGCGVQQAACDGSCGHRGHCVGGLHHPRCDCDPGWTGTTCATPTLPVSLGHISYIKVALSFSPDPKSIELQLRLRTKQTTGRILYLTAQKTQATIMLQLLFYLQNGVACLSVIESSETPRVACIDGRPVNDGHWHVLRAERHGHNLVLSLDDGDGWRHNESLADHYTSDHDDSVGAPITVFVDKQDGLTVGGEPHFAESKLLTVNNDLTDSCIDDLRLSGRSLPLSSSVNSSQWGQVSASEQVTDGCDKADVCLNKTCAPPLTCTPHWTEPKCTCGPGRWLSISSDGVSSGTCLDVDECSVGPCLHGGTCVNKDPGFTCQCLPGYTGDHCQWPVQPAADQQGQLAGPAALAAITASVLLLVLLAVLLSIKLHRLRCAAANRGGNAKHTLISSTNFNFNKDIICHDRCEDRDKELQNQKTKGDKKETHGDTQEMIVVHLKEKLTASGKLKGAAGFPYLYNSYLPHIISIWIETNPVNLVEGVGGVCDVSVGRTGHLFFQDDLRAYAYEGDGSSSGSGLSTISG
ncbi:unnamed protein product, partial [Meganyctiphanes norvegica]